MRREVRLTIYMHCFTLRSALGAVLNICVSCALGATTILRTNALVDYM